MHTGQDFIAPENALPQFGQVCRASVFMGLAAFSAASNATLHRVVLNGQRHPLANDGSASIAEASVFSQGYQIRARIKLEISTRNSLRSRHVRGPDLSQTA